MPPIPTIVVDDPSERASTGYRVVDGVEEAWRTYRVDTIDPLEAVLEGVLPAIGESYSVSAPRCVCVGYEPRVHATGAGGTVGAVLVRAVYRSPRPGSSTPPAGAAVKYATNIRFGRGTFRRLFRRSAVSGALPIAGGEGVPCTYSTLALDIYTYWAPGSAPSTAALNTLAIRNAINAGAVVTPPVLNTGQTYTLAQHTAKYVEYVIAERAGLIEIVHRLEISDQAWAVTVPVYNASRMFTGFELVPGTDQYEALSFAGLW